MPSEREGGDPRNNAEDAYLTFMEMSEDEWRGLLGSMLSGGALQPEEHKGFERASHDRLMKKAHRVGVDPPLPGYEVF